MTAENPWTSLGVATGDRRNLQVSTASAMAHGTSTANATVAATARALVLSVANSVVPTTATLGSPRQSPRKSAAVRGNYHGSARGLPTAAKTAIPRPFAAVRGHCHGYPLLKLYTLFEISNHFTPVMYFVWVRDRVRVSSMV